MQLFDREDLSVFAITAVALAMAGAVNLLTPEPPPMRTGGYLEDYRPPEIPYAPPPPAGIPLAESVAPAVADEDLQRIFSLLEETRYVVRQLEREVEELERPQAVVEGATAEDIAEAVWNSSNATGSGLTAVTIDALATGFIEADISSTAVTLDALATGFIEADISSILVDAATTVDDFIDTEIQAVR